MGYFENYYILNLKLKQENLESGLEF